MDFNQIVKKIKAQKGEYLCSIFAMDDVFQFDFYSKETKRVTSYTEEGKIKEKEQKVFQKESKDLEELNLSQVKVSLEEAKKILKENTKDSIQKTIIILQQDKIPLWNVSAITTTLNLVNLKIDAITGKILSQTKENILKFRSPQSSP